MGYESCPIYIYIYKYSYIHKVGAQISPNNLLARQFGHLPDKQTLNFSPTKVLFAREGIGIETFRLTPPLAKVNRCRRTSNKLTGKCLRIANGTEFHNLPQISGSKLAKGYRYQTYTMVKKLNGQPKLSKQGKNFILKQKFFPNWEI